MSYVSLYGITSYDEIETKFLEAIHPTLYNKKTIFAGKIAKQLLKATLKIDWDGNQQENAEIEVRGSNVNGIFMTNSEKKLILWNMEVPRCS